MIPRPDSPEEVEKFRRKMKICVWVIVLLSAAYVAFAYYKNPAKPITTVQFMDLQSVMYIPVRPAKLEPEQPEAVTPPAIELPRQPYTEDIAIGTVRFHGAVVHMTLDSISSGSLYMALTPAQCLKWIDSCEGIDGVILKWSSSKEDLLDKSLIPSYLERLQKRADLPYVVRRRE